MFDLGNNVNHASLRMIIPLDQIPALVENMDEINGKIIIQTQVLAEKLTVASECDDDEANEKNLASFGFEGNLSS
jgi:hypothetical protein